MTLIFRKPNGLDEVHISERLESLLLPAEEVVERMKLQIWFNVETRLPTTGEVVGKPYWDSKALELDCKNDSELAEAMRVIQRKIGEARYKQITAPPAISEPVEDPRISPPQDS